MTLSQRRKLESVPAVVAKIKRTTPRTVGDASPPPRHSSPALHTGPAFSYPRFDGGAIRGLVFGVPLSIALVVLMYVAIWGLVLLALRVLA